MVAYLLQPEFDHRHVQLALNFKLVRSRVPHVIITRPVYCACAWKTSSLGSGTREAMSWSGFGAKEGMEGELTRSGYR